MNELKINFDEKKNKKVEELVGEKKVTEEKIEDSLNYDLLTKNAYLKPFSASQQSLF